jgi:hydroxymethylglutaryl-CoA lyase
VKWSWGVPGKRILGGKEMEMPREVLIREVGPRDGFQSWPEFVPTEKKLEVIKALIQAGVKEMETTSFVSPKAVPQMRDAKEVMAGVPRNGCRHAALVPNLRGAELALEAEADELVVVISASESHNMANVRRTVAQSLEELGPIVAAAKKRNIPVTGAISVAFGCPYQGDVSLEEVFRVAGGYAEAGVRRILLADTTGMATPLRLKRVVTAVKEKFPELDVGVHLHNNRGTAMANLYAALEVGVTIFDTALGGIGGCPNVPQAAGNLATEDVVFMLEDMGISTGIDLVKVIKAARLLEEILGRTLPGQVMKSGPRDPELAERICGIPRHP